MFSLGDCERSECIVVLYMYVCVHKASYVLNPIGGEEGGFKDAVTLKTLSWFIVSPQLTFKKKSFLKFRVTWRGGFLERRESEFHSIWAAASFS